MPASDIFTLNNSIAPKLIRILYVVVLVLIAFGVIAGVARGIATIVRPQMQRVAVIAPRPPAPSQVAAPAAPPTAATAPAAPAPQAAAPAPAAPASAPPSAAAAGPAAPASGVAPLPPRGPRFGLGRGFRDGRTGGPGALAQGPRGFRFVNAPLRGGRDAAMAGAFQIARALVMGLIAVMVIRILAETANAVLVTSEKAR